mmetsp:Transcript_45147/g.125222  ORF Transcript_45147/g.125222 Transcript_45147/m.125222 type:complete len:143 (+) Transcript_45147:88-516(+)
MQIFIVDLNRRTVLLSAEPEDTVYDIKRQIQAKQGVTPGRQRLKTLSGRVLEDGNTLEDCGIHEHATLQLYIMAATRMNAPLEDTTVFARCSAQGSLENTTKLARSVANGSTRVEPVGACHAACRHCGSWLFPASRHRYIRV